MPNYGLFGSRQLVARPTEAHADVGLILIKKLLSIYFIQNGPPLSQFREMSSVFGPWIDSVRHRFIAHTHKIKSSVVFKEWIDSLDYLGGVTNGIAW